MAMIYISAAMAFVNMASGGAWALVSVAIPRQMVAFLGSMPNFGGYLGGSLALAYAAEAIRVHAVASGWIATPLTQALQEDEDRSRALLQRTPLGRWGRPEDVAQVAAFLCTPAASFMTATVVAVDGGYLAA